MSKPIIFTRESIRAILAGTKVQTRRVLNPKCKEFPIVSFERWDIDYPGDASEPQYDNAGRPLWISTEPDGTTREWHCPFGEPGSQLWVKETWVDLGNKLGIAYKADLERGIVTKWKSPIFMPKWASRITLEIKSVKVERLQQMGFYDWVKDFHPTWQERQLARASFTGAQFQQEVSRRHWDEINAKRGYPWDNNPWVWVISFMVVRA